MDSRNKKSEQIEMNPDVSYCTGENALEETETVRPVTFPSVMSIGEAARYLTISKYYLYMLVKAGAVPYSKLGKRILFRQQDLYDWLGRNTIEPTKCINCEDEDDFEK